MEEGILEVLIVNAEDIRHTNLLGTPAYYVILQCGTQEFRSKVSSGYEHDKVSWNEKFKFKFLQSDWENLTHIKLRIMDKEIFRDSGFVGETLIHLGGIITEGRDSGYMEVRPAPYNVVVEDDTYKGQMKVGFKFIAHKEEEEEEEEDIQQPALLPNEPNPYPSFFSSIKNLWKFPWWKQLLPFKQKDEHKVITDADY